MLGRSNPATISPSSGMPSCARMSARVRASAVAVSASRGTPAKRIEQRPQLAIVGAEIVAPFADAMRLVDREQRQSAPAEQAAETPRSRALRRDVKQVELAGAEARRSSPRARASAEVSEAARMPIASRRADLVVHQRDQRRDHQRRSRRAPAPAAGSSATCPRRSASPPACAGRP